MKTKILFTCMALCAMMIGFVSCEPTTLGKKNVLINLAELGNEVQSLSHMEQILQQKGFVKIHEEVVETEEYVDGTFVYANNIQLDSTLVNADDKITLILKPGAEDTKITVPAEDKIPDMQGTTSVNEKAGEVWL